MVALHRGIVEMSPGEETARVEIEEILDQRSGAVSGGALRRNATVTDVTEGHIGFEVIGHATDLGPTVLRKPPSGCTICRGSPPETVGESFRQAPFKGSSRYYVPDIQTHQRTQCEECLGAGKIQCTYCGGSGREECSHCSGDGYETVQERCDVCDGQPGEQGCQACDGEGTVSYRESCSRCDGTGTEVCSRCHGKGTLSCSSCDGSGKEHEYEAAEGEISRVFLPSGIPEDWSNKDRGIGSALNLPEANFEDRGEREFHYHTQDTPATYLTYEYGDEEYRVVVVEDTSGYDVVWDPETSYPETSWRRKLGDLKSRLFW